MRLEEMISGVLGRSSEDAGSGCTRRSKVARAGQVRSSLTCVLHALGLQTGKKRVESMREGFVGMRRRFWIKRMGNYPMLQFPLEYTMSSCQSTVSKVNAAQVIFVFHNFGAIRTPLFVFE
ncbi:hypothetical protein RHMOL_Rhmol03G0152800 [Rhododendron molle]|uniref:Uncharacterized protein n=1 Tax=Rhododendron molle TaxID=49168 RepID=A0ACC0PGX6_RHOML|nr:hypothetical protein RHMOL_Rhmol03G0152800 [Rhododendron molle]